MTEKRFEVPEFTGHLKKSYHSSLLTDIIGGKWVNERIEELRRLGYSDEYINIELGQLISWRI